MNEDVWVVVRCKSSSTLEIEETLTESGFRAWTPASYKRRRLPRRRTVVLERGALMPSFVFVREMEITTRGGFVCLEKHALKALTVSDGTVMRIRDRELDGLRTSCLKEDEAEDKPIVPPPIGSRWKLLWGPFSGRIARVEGVQGKTAKLAVEDWPGRVIDIGYVQLTKTAIRIPSATPDGL